MRKASLLAIAAFCLGGTAIAQENLPETCRGNVSSAAYMAPDEAAKADLQCDIDRAERLVARASTIFDADPAPLLRIVDTAAPSGAAYIYDIVDWSGTMMLDARTVPVAENVRIPMCRVQTQLPANVANQVALSLLTASDAELPAYGTREKMITNADGSRSFELLLSSHDIVTSIETTSGLRQFSRHAEATDPIAELNRSVIGVANFSDGWVCNAN
ncbi:MAG TPA: hypothetical protein DD728_15645 [Hyphomonas atlantica]|uniref:Uncharacterized protein n=1 Tax=Hyphomonas atlantica TaxID=1280948 RepID=A0A356WAE1_9PROT|nr:hypothetical protein [Hyphomonas atlantica]